MPHRVFVYGTLQFAAITEAVTGRTPAGVAARLHGYARYGVQRAPYPAIIPEPGRQVRGLVYPDIDPRELARIDDFEGDLYRRETVSVATENGEELAAYAYVLRRRFRTRLADAPWDEEAFRQRWHDAYVRACRAEYG